MTKHIWGNPVTTWEVFDKKEQIFKHNHLEPGHSQELTPIPKCAEQNCWKNWIWEKKLCYMDLRGRVINEQPNK